MTINSEKRSDMFQTGSFMQVELLKRWLIDQVWLYVEKLVKHTLQAFVHVIFIKLHVSTPSAPISLSVNDQLLFICNYPE